MAIVTGYRFPVSTDTIVSAVLRSPVGPIDTRWVVGPRYQVKTDSRPVERRRYKG